MKQAPFVHTDTGAIFIILKEFLEMNKATHDTRARIIIFFVHA